MRVPWNWWCPKRSKTTLNSMRKLWRWVQEEEHTCIYHTHYLYITIGILTSLHNVHIHTFWALLNTLHLIYRVDFASYLYIHHACMQAYYRNRVHSMKKEEAKCQLLKHMCQPSTTSAYFPVKVGPTYVHAHIHSNVDLCHIKHQRLVLNSACVCVLWPVCMQHYVYIVWCMHIRHTQVYYISNCWPLPYQHW